MSFQRDYSHCTHLTTLIPEYRFDIMTYLATTVSVDDDNVVFEIRVYTHHKREYFYILISSNYS